MHSAQDFIIRHDFSEISINFADKTARYSSGRRISHPAIVAPAGRKRSVRSGQLTAAKPSVQKVAAKAIGERAGHDHKKTIPSR